MKRLFLLLAVSGILLTACDEFGEIDEIGTTEQPDSDNTNNPDNTENPDSCNTNNPDIPADKTQIIKFQDDNAKLICILHWDENGDGEFSYEEAAAVTKLGTAFKGSRILAFTEFEYFTGLTEISDYEFMDCASLVSISIPAQILNIGRDAFSGCTNLKKISIPTLSAWCKIDFSGRSANPLSNGAGLYINGVKQTDITIPSDIKQIKDYAFYNYTSLTSVTIPDSVTSIGDDAFHDCTSLTSATIGNGVTSIGSEAFIHCTSLTSVSIGNSVTSIGEDAFYNCHSLKSVNVNDLSAWCKISFIKEDNIYNTSGVSANPLSNGAELYINGVKQTDITIPSDIKQIKDYAFYGCTSLKSVTIPDNVTSIKSEAFYKCYSLECVSIGNSVTSIGENAFYNCYSLKSVSIGNSVTSIGENAFYSCHSLKSVNVNDLSAWCKISFIEDTYTSGVSANPLSYGAELYINGVKQTDITIPSDIKQIKDYAFYGCTSLESVTIPDNVTSIGKNAFYNCTSLIGVTIPNSVTSIRSGAFSYCTSLKGVYIGNGVASIGEGAFENCTLLKEVYISDLSAWCKISFEKNNYATIVSANPLHNGAKLYIDAVKQTDITIPSDIKQIKDYAFYGCTSLTSVTIPDNVTSIGEAAFQNCGSLKSVYCKPTTPPKGGSYMFLYYHEKEYYFIGCKFYVPRNSVDAYMVARYWNTYASYIEGYDF